MADKQANWMDQATLFELLSLGFLTPQRITAQALVSGEFAEATDEVLSALDLPEHLRNQVSVDLQSYTGRDAEEVYHEILRDYTRLFVGEREPLVTPYVGIHAANKRGQQGLLFVGKESMAIERFMKAHGVAKNLSAGQINDPLDHIGTVCEFLKYLCLVNAQAVQPPEGVLIIEDDFTTFVHDLCGDYPHWCAKQVISQANTYFYRAMATMLQATCGDAAVMIGQLSRA